MDARDMAALDARGTKESGGLMACPNCQDWRDDGLCQACVQDGYQEAGCGCLEAPDGTLQPCGTTHRACDSGRSDACTGLATGQLTVPYLREPLDLCAACEALERTEMENGEPSDDQVANGPGMEGGIRYDRCWEQR